MTDQIDRVALRALLEKATPGPWWTAAEWDPEECGCAIIAARTDCGPLPGNPTRGMVAFASKLLPEEAEECEANATIITEARNTLPSLLDSLDAKDALIAELVGACETAKRQITAAFRIVYPGDHALCEGSLVPIEAALSKAREAMK